MKKRISSLCCLFSAAIGLSAGSVFGQQPDMHYTHVPGLPPGNVALMRGGVREYRQPVEIRAPQGTIVAFAMDSQFAEPSPAPALVGLTVGAVYRFQIGNIPYNEGRELYPSIEILDRLNPPQGRETEFPIVVDLTQEDLELALNGKFVTRVVYLESPFSAKPVRGDAEPISQDISLGADPVVIAETLGKPMAIVRIGGRIPNQAEPDPGYFFGSPEWTSYASVNTKTTRLTKPILMNSAARTKIPQKPISLNQPTSIKR